MPDVPPDAQPALRLSTMPADANAYGDIFGGWLVGQMDLAAGLVASRRCHGRAVTVAIDAIKFHAPVKVGDEVSIFAELVRVGRSSMTIEVEAWRRDRAAEESCRVTQATFVFVAVDDDGRPRVVAG